MSGEYLRKFSRRQCKIQLSRDILGEQKALKSAFLRLSKKLKSKNLQTWCHLRDILGLLQTSGGLNVCSKKFNDISVIWSAQKHDPEKIILDLENRSFENVSFFSAFK